MLIPFLQVLIVTPVKHFYLFRVISIIPFRLVLIIVQDW